MAATKSVFISHANDDKKRIKFLVDALMSAGFRLFIDHPEKIPGLDRNLVDSLWNVRDDVDDSYDKQLKKAIRECSCVLGVLSENTTADAPKATLRSEMERGDQLNKLVLCKIGAYDAHFLSGFIKQLDVANLEAANPPEQQEATLQSLAEKIAALIEANRVARREDVSERLVLGGSGAMNEKWREIRHILPLCVGRDDQRRAIRKAARRSEQTGEIVPVVVVGPENELPDRVAESLLFENMTGETTAAKAGFVTKSVPWPRSVGARFASAYLESLAKVVCNDDMAGQADIVRTLAGIGHNVVLVSSLDVVGEGLDIATVANWAAFWKSWGDKGQSGQRTVPVLNLVFGAAKAGWDLVEPKVPPGMNEDAAAHKRNAALFEQLRPVFPGRGTEIDTPQVDPLQLATPVRRQQFRDWANSINDAIVDGSGRMALQSMVEDGQFESPDALRDGVSHESLYNSVVKWFDDNSATGG